MIDDAFPPLTRPDAPHIERSNLGSDVYRILWERIINRELSPGEKLSDLRLSTELGVSRTPVREALHRLVQDGVVRTEPNRGFFVQSFNVDDIGEIFDLRIALESLALRGMAKRFPNETFEWAIADLDRVQAMIESAETQRDTFEASNAFLEIDLHFHQWIVEHSGNQRLIAMVRGLWAQIAVFQKAGAHIPGYMEVAIAQHHTIIELLLAKKVDDAATAMEDHIHDMKVRVVADILPHFSEEKEGRAKPGDETRTAEERD